MKKMKKILAFVMAMAMVLGMSVTSFAAGDLANGATATGTAADTGKIVVNGIEEPNRTDVKAYKIMPAIYSEDGKFVGYDQSLITDSDDKLTDTTLNTLLNDNFAVKLDQIYTDKVTNAEEGKKLEAITLDYVPATKTYEKTGLGVGMYMIVIPSTDSVTYSKAVASIFYTNGGSDYIFNNAGLTLSTKTQDGVTWMKKDVKIKVEKTVNNNAGNTANVGDELQYVVKIKVPNFAGKYPKLKVTDTLSIGLAYQNNAKIWLIDGTNETEITSTLATANDNKSVITPSIKEGKQVLEINFVKETETNGEKEYEYLLAGNEGKVVEIRYSAKLKAEAAKNGVSNGNTVELDYTRDSSKDYDDPTTKPDKPSTDETHTYTFDINGQGTAWNEVVSSIITKYGEEVDSVTNEKKPLQGATFTLYQTTEKPATGESEDAFRAKIAVEANKYTNKDENGTVSFDGTTTSDENGQIKITGLAAGTYYLKETTPPTGYSANEHVFKIEIIANPDAQTGILESWNIKIDDESIATFSVENTTVTKVNKEGDKGGIAIQNMRLSSLPSTGGIGTTIFTIGGCAIMILAAGLYFASRRKSAK